VRCGSVLAQPDMALSVLQLSKTKLKNEAVSTNEGKDSFFYQTGK